MSHYILRRDGRDYQAPDLETLRQWASDGRVLPADMVFSPKYQSWYRARDLRELRDALAKASGQGQAAASAPAQQFWLRKGEQNYAADDLDTILRWAADGSISPDDYIYHPGYGKWFRAGDSPQLVSRFPAHLREPAFLPAADDPMQGGAAADVERADSMARTVMDFRASEIQRALAAKKPASVVPAEAKPVTADSHPVTRKGMPSPAEAKPVEAKPVAEVRPLTRESGWRGTGSGLLNRDTGAARPGDSIERARLAPRPVETPRPVATPLVRQTTAERAVEAEEVRPSKAREETVSVAPSAPKTLSAMPVVPYVPRESAKPVEVEAAKPVEPAVKPAESAAKLDEEIKFPDRLGLLKLCYDVARTFVVTRDLRPGELLETACRLPSTGDDFLGLAKRPIYFKLTERLDTHLSGPVRQAASQMSDAERPGYEALVSRLTHLVKILRAADGVIGRKPPERVVIGNVGRPKMSPDEEKVMLDVDAALKSLISLKSKGA